MVMGLFMLGTSRSLFGKFRSEDTRATEVVNGPAERSHFNDTTPDTELSTLTVGIRSTRQTRLPRMLPRSTSSLIR